MTRAIEAVPGGENIAAPARHDVTVWECLRKGTSFSRDRNYLRQYLSTIQGAEATEAFSHETKHPNRWALICDQALFVSCR